MSFLRMAMGAGVLAYALVAIVQVVEKTSVQVQAGGILLLFLFAALVTRARDVAALKRYEMALLWGCVLFFSVYAVLAAGGLV